MSKLEVISFNKQIFHAVSLSGGKDSTAMLLLMIERGLPINTVLWADTGMEFPEMYDHISKVDDYLYRERGIHITMLRHPKGFEYLMFEEEKQKPSSIENRQRLGVPLYGNGWPGVKVRWCTGQLKTHLISKEVNRIKGEYQALHYVGIAADEPKRIKNEQYPLVDWGITEAEALKLCYDRGYDWGGLYEIYHRCSCWCCPLQRIDELRKLRHHHPELWKRLRDMDQRAIAQFGHNPLAIQAKLDSRTIGTEICSGRCSDLCFSIFWKGQHHDRKAEAGVQRGGNHAARHTEAKCSDLL